MLFSQEIRIFNIILLPISNGDLFLLCYRLHRLKRSQRGEMQSMKLTQRYSAPSGHGVTGVLWCHAGHGGKRSRNPDWSMMGFGKQEIVENIIPRRHMCIAWFTALSLQKRQEVCLGGDVRSYRLINIGWQHLWQHLWQSPSTSGHRLLCW